MRRIILCLALFAPASRPRRMRRQQHRRRHGTERPERWREHRQGRNAHVRLHHALRHRTSARVRRQPGDGRRRYIDTGFDPRGKTFGDLANAYLKLVEQPCPPQPALYLVAGARRRREETIPDSPAAALLTSTPKAEPAASGAGYGSSHYRSRCRRPAP